MKKFIRRMARNFGIEIKRIVPDENDYERDVVSLMPLKAERGQALLSYILNPFSPGYADAPCNPNQRIECLQIARTFLELGYSVDVIHYRNGDFVPRRDYSIFLDIHTNLQRLSPLLPKRCIKILHPLWAHWLFNNCASFARCLDLQQRRGVTVRGLRLVEPNQGIEHADCAVIEGSHFSPDTFRYANKPIYRLPQATTVLLPWPEEKDFDACRKNFLWLSGGGLVHKGLDLALEAFSEMPECHLYVCGPVEKEKEFEEAYAKELYRTPNIHPLGWVDLNSPHFLQIAGRCAGYVHFSCSEACSGSVIAGMHAGLIPIVSYESAVDVKEFGILLKDCSIARIKDAVDRISCLDPAELKERARQTWEYARAFYTRDRFAGEFKRIIASITEAA
jgi:glycosyltransferase involved in cell wall biosynthesis